MPEAESELVAGYHSEYSSMKFSMFMIGEYAHVVTIAAMVATLFFGGWDIPFTNWDEGGGVLRSIATFASFFVKMFFWIYFVMWIRWTLPRFRYDQLMTLGWKVLLPLALAYIMVTAGAIQGLEAAGVKGIRPVAFALTGLNVGLGWLLFSVLDRGRVMRGVSRRTPLATPRTEGVG
jgi:NADH-quinone oxidoreductase subunit H